LIGLVIQDVNLIVPRYRDTGDFFRKHSLSCEIHENRFIVK
jgi:hypothetical protein